LRDFDEHAEQRRAADRHQRVAQAQARREREATDARTADLDAHPQRRMFEGLDVLALIAMIAGSCSSVHARTSIALGAIDTPRS
jgi:hypothetical protein